MCVLTYVYPAWTIEKQKGNRLLAAEMWFWRRNTKSSLTARMANDQIVAEVI